MNTLPYTYIYVYAIYMDIFPNVLYERIKSNKYNYIIKFLNDFES